MDKYAMRKLAFLSALLLTVLTVHAQEEGFYMDPLEILPGAEQSVTLKLRNSEGVKGFQLNVVLPEGLSFVSESVSNIGRLDGIGYTVRSSLKASGALGLIAVHGGTFIPAGDDAILSFMVKAAADAVVGETEIVLSDIKISLESQNYVQPNATVAAYIGNRSQAVSDMVWGGAATASVYSLWGYPVGGDGSVRQPSGSTLRPGVYIVGRRKTVVR